MKQLCRHQHSCSCSEYAAPAESAALQMLSRYFGATRDSDVASVPVKVGQIFLPACTASSQPLIGLHGAA